MSFINRKHTAKTKKKMRLSIKKLWQKIRYREKRKKSMDNYYNSLKDKNIKRFSREERARRSERMSRDRKSGKIKTWNKNKSLWRENQSAVLKMKKSLKGRHLTPSYEFKKGHKNIYQGLGSRKNGLLDTIKI